MKPNFALNFTDDSIALLHRTRRGWAELGSTAFDVEDLPAALADLKAKAAALAPEGFTTKLVIPASQIKYLRLPVPGPDVASRQTQIAAALEGQTPYDVADLVWDHSGEGDTVTVAVLARETLDEAESFAAEHGFNPVSFVALAEGEDFVGEPWFGTTGASQSILKKGETVERDAEAIRLRGNKNDGDQSAAPIRAQEPDPEPAPNVPEPLPEPEPAPVPEITPADDPLPEVEPQEPEPVPLEIPEPPEPEIPGDTPLEDPPFDDQPVFTQGNAAFQSEAAVDPAAIAATLRAGDPPAIGGMHSGQTAVLSGRHSDADEAPMALDVPDDVPEARPAPRNPNTSVLIDPSVEDDLPPMPSGAALSAYSRRPAGPTPDPAPRTAPVAPPLGPATPDAPRPAKSAERATGPRVPKLSYETPGEAAPPPPVTKAPRGMTGIVTAPSIPGGRKAKVAPSVAPPALAATAEAVAQQAAQPTRRPQGLGSRPMPVRGKPRHLGLILTGILLIMLALAAGLSSFYVSWRDGDPAEAVDVAAIDAPAADAAPQVSLDDLPAPEDEMLADMIDPAEAEGDLPAQTEANAAAEPVSEASVTATPEEALPATDGPAPATAIAGDPAPANAPASEAQDEIFLAARDMPPAALDPVVLQAPTARMDLPPQPQAPPPPFGTVYQFDENGLIRPTPEGIATPEGVLLFAGRPALVPPPRPPTIAAAPQVAPAAEAATTANPVEPEFTIPADPALADNRPRLRPANLVPPVTETATDDDASIAPQDDSRIASIRPNARPASLTERAAAAGLLQPASTPASGNPSLALVAPEGTVTPLGLAISRRPAARPEDMNLAVAAAVAAAIRQPDPEPPEAEVTPETEEEPEVVATAPRIPASANVAQQATLRNAINLREMNLIGVYGTSADRYALVRNPNGRYIKVSVGDRLDGGRVAAITASELRYEKRGRMIVLELPNS